MRAIAVLAVGLAVAGCGDEASEQERAERDRLMVEKVREVNNALPPQEDVVPEAILYPDIEANDMFGLACAYAPGTSLGARVIAREGDAFIKIDGEVLRFAADSGSPELQAGTRTLYTGNAYTLRLAIDGEGRPDPNAAETTLYEGTVYLRDRWNRVVYQGSGSVSCGA